MDPNHDKTQARFYQPRTSETYRRQKGVVLCVLVDLLKAAKDQEMFDGLDEQVSEVPANGMGDLS